MKSADEAARQPQCGRSFGSVPVCILQSISLNAAWCCLLLFCIVRMESFFSALSGAGWPFGSERLRDREC